MKITDSQPPANDSKVEADDRDKSQNAQNNETSTFSHVLAKKREANQDSAQPKGGKHKEGDTGGTAPGLMGAQASFDQPLQPAPLESKSVVEVPPELQQLVREISVVVNANGNQQVHIELNSNVLKGLHIRIERQNGAIAVQFQSSSDDVARLLSRNIDALSQGLAERGVSVADIHVSGSQESAGSQNYKGRSNFGGRWQGGRQRSRR